MDVQHSFVNLDELVDYQAEYTAVIKKYQIAGERLTGLCPFHEDHNSSFSANLKTGLWKCHAEDRGGNLVTFRAEYDGISTQEAFGRICEKYRVSRPKKQKKATTDLKGYSLEEYALQKRLPADWLAREFSLTTGRDRNGIPFLRVPYFNAEGAEATHRKRYADKQFRWKAGSGDQICLYNEWQLNTIREEYGFVLLVEGESDTQSLSYLGYPALGVPGASMFRPRHAEPLKGLKLYLHQEPDHGGEVFVRRVCEALTEVGFDSEVCVWSCRQAGGKDPSELLIRLGEDDAILQIGRAIRHAEQIDFRTPPIPTVIADAPISLRTPAGWEYSDAGIVRLNDKKNLPPRERICRTPILLTRRLRNAESGEEKMEVAFQRDGRWHTAIYPRSILFTSHSVIALADLGCTVTSENAKAVVQFLSALEAENLDVIPAVRASGILGWQQGGGFVPGFDDGIVLDIDPTQRAKAAAYTQNGTMERWTAHMREHRSNSRFRFLLAAGFAAPLLRIVRQRIFVVYNWASSKGGKTAALKAALSVWGDPERLMVNFNATQVGLERMAAFYCDLPLGIDERQLAGNNQASLEKIVYMLSSGTGKVRGTKGGGLQRIQQWRTVALATGEEPLTTATSQTGVSTRVLELYGSPFEDEQAASRMHQQAAQDYGWAGTAFIRQLVKLDEDGIRTAFERLQERIYPLSAGKNRAHIAGISVVALADAMIDSWIFGAGEGETDALGIRETSWTQAEKLAEDILHIQEQDAAADVNENAVQFIVDWVLSNRAYFHSDCSGTCLGAFDPDGQTVFILPSKLDEALREAGYSPQKTKKYLAEQNLMECTAEQGRIRRAVKRRFMGKSVWMVGFRLAQAIGDDAVRPGGFTELAGEQLTDTWPF
ncbi:MAG: DUF927 domain-containing protein [Butyricicoccaceae bacterium]